MNTLRELDLHKYRLIIFDWDGTLVDSLSAYEAWDKLYIKKFYNVDLPLEYFKDLASKMKKVDPGRSEDKYFRYLDEKFGDGSTPIDQIWKNIYTLSPEIQSKILYKKHAADLLKKLKLTTKAKVALATNSEQRDIDFFSTKHSATAALLSPMHYFDKIVTLDDINDAKPHPESFQKVIDYFLVDPRKVLVFEDSLYGVQSAKSAGVDVVLYDDAKLRLTEVMAHADYVISDWQEIIELLD